MKYKKCKYSKHFFGEILPQKYLNEFDHKKGIFTGRFVWFVCFVMERMNGIKAHSSRFSSVIHSLTLIPPFYYLPSDARSRQARAKRHVAIILKMLI